MMIKEFDELRKYATKHNINNDEQAIYLKRYTLYPDGSIWLNVKCFNETMLSVSVEIATERTPNQMLQFIESLI